MRETVQNFKQSVLSKNNPHNLHLMKIQRNLEDFDKRKQIIKQSKKWDDFKQRRTRVQDQYIQIKKKHLLVKQILVMVLRRAIIIQLNNKFQQGCLAKEQLIVGKFMNAVIANRWKKRRRKFANSLD